MSDQAQIQGADASVEIKQSDYEHPIAQEGFYALVRSGGNKNAFCLYLDTLLGTATFDREGEPDWAYAWEVDDSMDLMEHVRERLQAAIDYDLALGQTRN